MNTSFLAWFPPLIRIAAAAAGWPGAEWLLPAISELQGVETERRLRALEDPISGLHPDVPEVARELYGRLPSDVGTSIELDEQTAERYRRALAMLEANGMLTLTRFIGVPTPQRIARIAPAFLVYMAGVTEDGAKMQALFERVEGCKPGTWLRGTEIAEELGLPPGLVRGVFEAYAATGLGVLSRELGTANYRCTA